MLCVYANGQGTRWSAPGRAALRSALSAVCPLGLAGRRPPARAVSVCGSGSCDQARARSGRTDVKSQMSPRREMTQWDSRESACVRQTDPTQITTRAGTRGVEQDVRDTPRFRGLRLVARGERERDDAGTVDENRGPYIIAIYRHTRMGKPPRETGAGFVRTSGAVVTPARLRGATARARPSSLEGRAWGRGRAWCGSVAPSDTTRPDTPLTLVATYAYLNDTAIPASATRHL